MENNKNYKTLVWDRELLEKFWDYESQFPKNYFAYYGSDEIVKRLKQLVPLGSHIVDYGGGAGLMTEALLDAGFRVSFADHSPRSIVEVTRKYKDRPGFLGAYHVDDLNPLESSADVVIMIELIEHLYDEPLNVAVQQAGKMLGPSGKIFITTPNDEDLDEGQIYCPQCDHVRHQWQHVRKWDSDSLKKFLIEKNFDVESIDAVHMLDNIKTRGTLRLLINKFKKFVKIVTSSKPARLIAVVTKNR